MQPVAIAPGAWLDAPAAASWARMVAAGCPTGGITDAGRTYAEQLDMWRRYKAGLLKATAAYPGTSKHETGRALDLSGATRTWVRKHGAAFGWMRDRVKREPWHMEYVERRDQHRVATPVIVTTPLTTTTSRDWFDMATLADLKDAQPAQIVYFFIEGDPRKGAVYEAVLAERTYAHVPDEKVLASRRDVIGFAGWRWVEWAQPVSNTRVFGREVPWS